MTEENAEAKPKTGFLPLLVLLAVSAAVYSQTIDFAFVNFDDDLYVFNDVTLRWTEQSWSDRLFTPFIGYPTAVPLAIYAMLHATAGALPSAFHAVSVLVHLLNIVLVFALLRRLCGDPRAVIVATAFWALHPVLAETVSWVTALKELTLTFGVLTAMLAVERWLTDPEERTRPGVVLALTLGAAIALFSKPTGLVIGPLAVGLVLLLRPVEGARRRKFALLVAALLAAGIAVALTSYGLHAQYGGQREGFSPLMIAAAATLQLQQYLLPLGLAVIYRPEPPMVLWLVAPLVGVGLAVVSWRTRRDLPLLGMGALWLVITYAPVSNIVLLNRFTADSYAYLPSIGLAIVITALLSGVLSEAPDWRTNAVCGVILSVLAALSWNQAGTWRDSAALWTNALERYPEDPFVRMKLGQAAYTQGAFELAIEMFESVPADRYGIDVPFPPRWALSYCRMGNNTRCVELLIVGLEAQNPDGNEMQRRNSRFWHSTAAGALQEFAIDVTALPLHLQTTVREASPIPPP